MQDLLNLLKAVSEPTRLRLLLLCAQSALTVTELVHILGQSQPRLSRHLKLLCDSGALIRTREGTHAYFQINANSQHYSVLAQILKNLHVTQDEFPQDAQRLVDIQEQRQQSARAYFRQNAEEWDQLRGNLHGHDDIEALLITELREQQHIDTLLDIGTGTGRVLQLAAPYARTLIGLDQSREMLAVARSNLDQWHQQHMQNNNREANPFELRFGDMTALTLAEKSIDIAIMYQVLHYSVDPGRSLLEVSRILKPGGELWIIDLAPHQEESFHLKHAHQHFGFSTNEIDSWCQTAKLSLEAQYDFMDLEQPVIFWKVRAALAA